MEKNKKWIEMYAEQGAVSCLAADLVVISARKYQQELDYAPKDQLFYSSQEKYAGAYSDVALAEETQRGFRYWTSDENFKKFISVANHFLKTNEEIFQKYISTNEVGYAAYKEVGKNLTETTGAYLLTQPQRQEDLEKQLKKELAEKIGEDYVEVYQKITQSEKVSSLQKEKFEFFSLVQEIVASVGWDASLREALKSNPTLQERLNQILKKYKHVAIGGFSNDWRNEKYYEDLFNQLKENQSHFENEYAELQQYESVVSRTRTEIVKKYKLSNESLEIANRLAEIGYLRLEMHYSYDHLHYLANEIIGNVAKKFDISDDLLFYLTNNEVLQSLQNNSIAPELKERAEERKLAYLFLVEDNSYALYSGMEAKALFNSLLPEEDYSAVKELKGQSAYRGQIRGSVRVFKFTGDSPELHREMRDFKKGEVLVASQTAPIMMPAILKASAIITDEGGITAHAAIVARELKKPCIVGTKVATKALRTGDLVEVDANTGTVRILR